MELNDFKIGDVVKLNPQLGYKDRKEGYPVIELWKEQMSVRVDGNSIMTKSYSQFIKL